METVYLGVGSNLGDPMRQCMTGLARLRMIPDIRLTGQSGWYLSEPLGDAGQPWYINGVIRIATSLSPLLLLEVCHELENQAERRRDIRWGPRTLDLDILLWEKRVVISNRLTIPHPGLHLRRFVLIPMIEIAPYLQHPLMGQTMKSILDNLADGLIVRPASEFSGD